MKDYFARRALRPYRLSRSETAGGFNYSSLKFSTKPPAQPPGVWPPPGPKTGLQRGFRPALYGAIPCSSESDLCQKKGGNFLSFGHTWSSVAAE